MQLAMDGETIGPVIIAALQTEDAAIGSHSNRDQVADGLRSSAAGVVTSQTFGMHKHKDLNHWVRSFVLDRQVCGGRCRLLLVEC